jgi:hypothetical protein
MTAESIACPACGEPVPFGRRTCEACGAYVTGDAVAARAMATETEGPPTTSDAGGPAVPAVTEPELAASVGVAEPESEAVSEATAAEPAGPEMGEPLRPEATEPAEGVAPGAPVEAFVPPVLREWTAGSPVPETAFAVEVAAAEGGEGVPGVAGAWLPPSSVHRVVPSTSGPVSAAAGSGARPWARPSEPAPTIPDATPAASGGAATVTPSRAAAATTPEATVPQMPASLATMLGSSGTSGPRWPGDAPAGQAASRPAPPIPKPGDASLLADLPFDAPDSLPGWLVAAGGGLAAVAFFLPWVAVIGSYFDAWGFGPIAHLPIFLLVIVATALSIVSNRVAAWLRHGVLGLVVGGLLLGLVWNRLFGAAGGQIGVFLEVVAAILLIAGGVLAVAPPRGGPEAP